MLGEKYGENDQVKKKKKLEKNLKYKISGNRPKPEKAQ